MIRLVRVIALAIAPAVLGAPALFAQGTPDRLLGNGELSLMRLPLQPVQPTPQLLTHWDTEPHWSFTPFDEARFGFRSVTLTLDREPFDCGGDGRRALVHVIVALEGAGSVRYWRLSEPVDGASSNICDLDDSDRWAVVDAVSRQPDLSATLGTPDATVPIFRVAYSASWPGRTSVDNYQQLMIDARNLIPVAPARLTTATIDGFCVNTPDRPETSCQWDSGRSDFLCTETFGGGTRYSWMMSGERLIAPPGSREPANLAAFVTTLLAAPNAIGRWAEPLDVGAVRLIAEVPSRTPGRRILLFGASASFGSPFVVAVRDGVRTRVIPVPIANASTNAAADPLDPPVPIGEFRLSGEPPAFTVQTSIQDGRGTRLLRVVSESESFRTLYHVAIEDTAAQIVAGAIHVTSSLKTPEEAFYALEHFEPDACDNAEGGFTAPARIQLAPLTVTYDIEPEFMLRDEHPQRDDAGECVVSSRATWTAGKGFTLTYQSAACSNVRFRGAYVQPDGSLDIHTYRPAP